MLKKLFTFMILVLSATASFAKTPQDTLVIAHRINEIVSLDPAAMFEFSSLEYANNVYERLLRYDKDTGTFTGVIAKGWSISKDGTVYCFHLKPDLKFASGNAVTAEDVVFSLQRAILLQKAPAFLLTQFGFNATNVDSNIKAIDNQTVQITLSENFAPNIFLNCLTNPVASIVEKAVVQQHQIDDDMGSKWLSTNHAGSGPFSLITWQANELLAMKKNPYYKKDMNIEKIVVKHVKEVTTQRLLLEQGDVDIARNLPPQELPDNLYKIKSDKDWLIYLSLNQSNPHLKKPEVRQAIKYLIDYQGIQENLLSDNASVHQSFIPKGFFAANTTQPFSYNLEKAKQLLKQAGYPNGFKIRLDAKNLPLAQAIQASLAKANIEVSIIPGDDKQVLTKYRKREHDMLLAACSSDYQDPHANAANFVFNMDNSSNSTQKTFAWRNNWHIPKLSQKTLLAVQELDTDKRMKYYTELQQDFFNESPIIILFQQQEVAVLNKQVTGFHLGLSAGSTDYRDVVKHG